MLPSNPTNSQTLNERTLNERPLMTPERGYPLPKREKPVIFRKKMNLIRHELHTEMRS